MPADLLAPPALPAPPPADDLTRRDLLRGTGALTLAGFLAACGMRGDADGAGAGAGGQARTIEHEFGTVEVPAAPEAVVALFTTVASALASVGVTPVAAAEPASDFLAALADRLPDEVDLDAIEPLPLPQEINVERVLALGPDLVIATSFTPEEQYALLAEAAPTAYFAYPGTERWKELFDEVTATVGRAEDGERVKQRYRERRDRLTRRADGIELSLVRPPDAGQLTIDAPASFAGEITTGAGFVVTDPPAGVGERPNEALVNLSTERLDLVTGQVLVVPDFSYGRDPDPLAALEAEPLWGDLPAVREGRVVVVSGALYNGGTYLAAELLLDELEAALDRFEL